MRPILPVLLVLAAACGDDGDATLRVFAAASLRVAFAEIEAVYEEAHPGVDVVLNLAGSSTLRAQIQEGAPADVFAAASPRHAQGIGGAPETFATNSLQLAVPAANPGGVTGLDDLARADLLVGLCAADVPCGDLARRVLADAGIEASVDTEEPDVAALVAKIAEGELDAGLVYRTDVLAAADDVIGIDVDGPVTEYPVVAVSDDALADEFVAFLVGDEAQAILADHGFGPP